MKANQPVSLEQRPVRSATVDAAPGYPGASQPPAEPRENAYRGPDRRQKTSAEPRERVYRGPDRRKPSLKSFVYGAFNPRRRRFRREEDRDSAFIDWYPTHLLVAAGMIMCLSVADGLLTIHLLNAGATELNPLLAVLVHNDPLWFALGKIFLTGAGVVSLVVVSQSRLLKRWSMEWMIYGLLFAYAVLVLYSYNLSTSIA